MTSKPNSPLVHLSHHRTYASYVPTLQKQFCKSFFSFTYPADSYVWAKELNLVVHVRNQKRAKSKHGHVKIARQGCKRTTIIVDNEDVIEIVWK